MKKILIITAIFSFAFSTTYTNKNTILETKLNRIQNKWVVTNAYVMKGKVKKDALKEFHSTQFEFKKNNKLKITDSKRRNKSDYGSWEFNGLNSLRIHLYESNINI